MVLTPTQMNEAFPDEEALLPVEAAEAVTTSRSWSRRVVLPGLVLALCSAVLLLPARATTAQVQAPHRLVELIKLHALDTHGVRLSDSAVGSAVARARAKPGRTGRLARRLSSEETTDQDAMKLLQQAGLSEACSGAIAQTVEDMMDEFSKLLADTLVNCIGAGLFGTGGCEEEDTDASVDQFFGNLTQDCTESGDNCNVTFTDPGDAEAEPESQHFCVPKECHAEAKGAVKFLIGEAEELEGEEAEGDAGEGIDKESIENAIQLECATA